MASFGPTTAPRPGKRARTRALLLANAIALFRDRGFTETKLADVARAADVAPATLYNHFPSRAALAGAWVRGEIEEASQEAARQVVDDERGLRAGMRGLCRAIARTNAPETALRLEAWKEAARVRAEPAAALVRAIEIEQRREHVRADRPAAALADLLLDAIEGGLVSGLRALDASSAVNAEKPLAVEIQARVDLVLDGARKRNERVRAESARGATR